MQLCNPWKEVVFLFRYWQNTNKQQQIKSRLHTSYGPTSLQFSEFEKWMRSSLYISCVLMMSLYSFWLRSSGLMPLALRNSWYATLNAWPIDWAISWACRHKRQKSGDKNLFVRHRSQSGWTWEKQQRATGESWRQQKRHDKAADDKAYMARLLLAISAAIDIAALLSIMGYQCDVLLFFLFD